MPLPPPSHTPVPHSSPPFIPNPLHTPGILRSIILSALAPHRLSAVPDPLPSLSRASLVRLGAAGASSGALAGADGAAGVLDGGAGVGEDDFAHSGLLQVRGGCP
jgi:hypothetical protein